MLTITSSIFVQIFPNWRPLLASMQNHWNPLVAWKFATLAKRASLGTRSNKFHYKWPFIFGVCHLLVLLCLYIILTFLGGIPENLLEILSLESHPNWLEISWGCPQVIVPLMRSWVSRILNHSAPKPQSCHSANQWDMIDIIIKSLNGHQKVSRASRRWTMPWWVVIRNNFTKSYVLPFLGGKGP